MDNTSIQSEIEEIRALRRQLRIWRPILVLMLAVVILICVLMLWSGINALVSKGEQQDEFVQQLGGRLENDVLPLVQEVGREALSGIDFNKEIDQLNARAPEIANAGLNEMRLLGTDNLEVGRRVLAEQFDEALKGRETMLKQEFPDASEEQIASFLTDFTGETKAELTEYVDILFTPHLATMNSMIDDLKVIEATEGPTGAAGMPTWEMAFLFADIARADLNEIAEPDEPAPSAAKTGKEKSSE